MTSFDLAAFRIILESFANVSVTLAELLEKDPEIASVARELSTSPENPGTLARLREKILQYSREQPPPSPEELAMRSLAASAFGLIQSVLTEEGAGDEGDLKTLTERDWIEARRALGRGSYSILFGTSDRVLDRSSDSLQSAADTRT